MKEIVEEITKDALFKKSQNMARAIAQDLTDFSGREATAMEGTIGRKSRQGIAIPGYFIRTTIYKVGWEKFLKRTEAVAFRDLMMISIDRSRSENKITEEVKDFGILEALKLVQERNSPLYHTNRVYSQICRNRKFGL